MASNRASPLGRRPRAARSPSRRSGGLVRASGTSGVIPRVWPGRRRRRPRRLARRVEVAAEEVPLAGHLGNVGGVPAVTAGELVESGDLARRPGRRGVAAELGDPVVRWAAGVAVELAGRSALAVGHEVVDVAAVGGFVATGGVLAAAVSGDDRFAQGAGERASAGHGDDGRRPVEEDRFQVGPVEVGDELAGGDDGAVPQLAEPGHAVVADRDAEQGAGPLGVVRSGGGAFRHHHQR